MVVVGLLLVAAIVAVAGLADRDIERWHDQREQMDLMAVRECRLQRNKRQWNRG